MNKIELNIKIELNENDYEMLMSSLKDVMGECNKNDLEEYISDGLLFDIENNNEFLFD